VREVAENVKDAVLRTQLLSVGIPEGSKSMLLLLLLLLFSSEQVNML
jgi:hypothetical protein